MLAISAHDGIDDLNLVSKPFRKKRTSGAIYDARYESLSLAEFSFSPKMATGDAPSRIVLLNILNG
jgi:hypothetical protein